ncbi:hypothetical protein MED121_14744 [Marinomonas sp. MED121]|uniref:DUF1835 domain-containing protein n=1 Tax=Marinomonas sp. MED121 TaxID=314277 RepID=UPI0000691097|nr:DUF1835 domain-containing protein [Marinomonas sp. MED121]EAQ67194.1 hypothetical protein MED121_14744 [Marinomonas sp. MED121]
MNTPFRLNLEQQKKRAKELLKSFDKHDVEAIERFVEHHPKLRFKEARLEVFSAKLTDAQLVIARELGCQTWSQLRHHISLMGALQRQIDQTDKVDDEAESCLHIRCGSDIEKALNHAGFRGAFLEFSDPFCVGPVTYDYDLEQRAHFLYESYCKEYMEQDYAQVLADLSLRFKRLKASIKGDQHVVLWFEHDPYDQFILIYILSFYHRFGLPNKLWLVTTNAFPGGARFQGLGQLPPEGLRLLWQTKQAVTPALCQEADRHWAAFTHPNPQVFHQYVQGLAVSHLPYFKTAALRQLQDQPIQANQLPLTQQFILELLSESGAQTAGHLFRHVMTQKEPLPFLGDIMFWHILQKMEASDLVQFADMPEHWPKTLIRLN